MMMKLSEMKSGTKFTCMGVEYEFIRHAGTCQTLNRNQWGRATGGTHTAEKVAVRVNRLHRGWSPVHYTAFYPGHSYNVKDN